ncbi:dephospho-CoA kinase [Halorhodospira halochloris]|uniref:Dephospho-CoA kinase n=1 Tax=Halorhodospira halochloris TaxID=1052 RepID=A0A0X8XAG8_HALHR|nr:dephospho-CoA kinase [Halorhodospira halochloris]MCG5530571.1 dephospho-CoA kinase [Halorhodospira halochloris]MCG5547847.1 dephospho-CoA kinase [Halorhodospira halochloris]BAU58439.1 dephospho-CoA kinase [Halorhodospira halochloris]
MRKPLKIGLTGGIASGKTTIANLFASRCAPIIDTDIIARQVVEPGTEGLQRIQEQFGEAAIKANGELDRAYLANLIFSDEQSRKRLEQILHPLIMEQVALRLEQITAPYAILVIPLLIETGMEKDMDRVLVIDISEQEQLKRITSRDAITTTQAQKRIKSQASRSQRQAKADQIIHNEGSMSDLELAVMRLHYEYTLAARAN